MKRKIGFILFAFIAITQLSLAQSDSVNYYPSKGFAGIGFNVTGIISNTSLQAYNGNFGNDLVFGRYFISDKSALRIGIGPSIGQYQQIITDSVGAARRNFDTSYVQSSVFVEFGIERHLFTTNRLDPYFGASLNLGLIGQSRIKTKLSLEDTTGVSEITTDTRLAGGFRLGVSTVIGFNYFVAKHLAIGAEYSLSYGFMQTGGDFDRVIINTPVTGQSTSRRELGSNLERLNSFDLNSQIAIRLSYYFPLKKNSSSS